MISTLGIVLLALVILLFVLLFGVSFTTTKGANSMADLKRYLQRLTQSPNEMAKLNPEAERARMETLLNRVKTSNTAAHILKDIELKKLLDTAFRQVCTENGKRAQTEQSGFIKLKNVYCDFGQRFYAGLTTAG